MLDDFSDIGPYHDHEVNTVLNRLMRDKEFIAVMTRLRFGRKMRWLLPIMRRVVHGLLAREVKDVHSVLQFQRVVKKYMDQMIEKSTGQFTVSGLKALDPNKPYLFISNHRDIALDSAFVNYALYHNGHDTVRIAIGDNLLTKPWVSDLMRLNKSFIVRRSAKGPRQTFAVYKQLSAYIRYSIEKDCDSIWIAQREGRAKDGRDRTEPAIIKMLAMSRHKEKENLSDYIDKLHIVPVAISYEWDPCDGAKAEELYETEKYGHYKKRAHEDIASISQGIMGNKGHVHVSFGTPLNSATHGSWTTPEQVATDVDRQIITNYKPHATNLIAYQLLHGHYPSHDYRVDFDQDTLGQQERHFKARIGALPSAHRKYVLSIYAAIIEQKLLFTEA